MSNDALLAGGWRIPVFTLTGFLGSGKTSLLVRLMREPSMARTALVVNEFGDVGIDQLTLRQVDANVRLLEHGCLCCTTREDLLETLRGLYVDRLRGVVPPFDRVIVETSGLADPIPVIHTLLVDPLLQERYASRGTVTAFDLTQPLDAVLARVEGARQVAAADAFVLTKGDLPGALGPSEVIASLRRLNPDAIAFSNDDDAVRALASCIAAESLDAARPVLEPTAWMLGAIARARGPGRDERDADVALPGRAHRPSPVASFVVRSDRPIPVATASAWIERVVARNASRLLRLKGVVEIAEQDDPIVVHAVRHLFHPATTLPRRADDPRGTRLVLIVDNPGRLSRDALGAVVLGAALHAACERGEPVRIDAPAPDDTAAAHAA